MATIKAQINKVNEGAVLVSFYNNNIVVNQKWFNTEKKANNFCKKYNYEVEKMDTKVCNYAQYQQ